MSVSTVLAKALFDNAAESPEELAFRKGDILMVLEQEQGGGPGWWLCSLHGRQGIAPANRLRLLQTAPPPGSDPRRVPSEDSVYLSPVPPLARTAVSSSAEDIDGVYRSPPGVGEGRGAASRPGELRRVEVGRPRSHSSSGTRPRPDWDLGVAGRPRSPSLRGRGTEITGTLYQTPVSPLPSAAQHARQPGASESVYLAPTGVPRAADEPEDTTYLVPRETLTTGQSDDCYLVPKGTPLAGDDVYQSPTGGVVGTAVCSNGPSGTPATPQPKVSQDTPGLYQTPTAVGASLHRTSATVLAHQHPSQLSPVQASPRSLLKGISPNPAVARGKPGLACHRGSPLLVRAGQARVPGSPNFARKPPPPAPPVRGVTRKDAAADSNSVPKPTAQVTSASLQQEEDKQKEERMNNGLEKSNNVQNKKGDSDAVEDQVYDTPPTGRWQRPIQSSLSDDVDGIYDTPRSVPPQADSENEVYDVPTITLNVSTSDIQPDEVDDDVYSVPTLPGVPLGPGESNISVEDVGQVYRVPGPEKRASGGGLNWDSSEPDCGIYDMPALTAEVLPHSLSSSSTSTRRLSVSSNGSGDVQWRATLSSLVHSVLSTASCSATALSSRDLATSLAEILSTWKACHSDDPPPPLQQVWSRLSDLLPALSAIGNAPPSEGLLTLVQRSLEESALLLQAQGRPRLPSQDSLSRRPLPALPVPDGKSSGGGMGSRKGSWIQERPLPPTPQPAFPLPPTLSTVTLTVGPLDGEDDPSNEYAGIGLTPIPAPVPTGDSVGYVKLQGKPEPLPDVLGENGHMHTITADPTLTTSPPLPMSLSLEDSELLSFYSSQSLAHLSCLADAIDVLFSSVQGNQPPRIFVARGKSLIVTAHKLVFIGDTLSRLLTSADLRAKITTSGGRLCQALKSVVVATKGAAQNYPSVSATQEMVDRVAELSQQAAGFSTLLQRLAEISS
ncbi:embryonal Fyn-associated substrate [Sebastes umbrosus]|uniref:embryonal Fyn-associated substrate n=1 Tax=Sebastes umbrosus TaxID=72105 RepID=UPI00189CCE54|nr:embryonal Fyn-associated substrate [Sebastes umbrosus]XP_037614484.1 embryonal Fyn-associated substrate [Sebastes umbrosus]XP_037614485.1 embryonal Fyn-associated substrate [Sebastes umbrosus]XP_037614486.1 embryonal Fyn-associated substrate [Sebastes umbrosus]